MRQNPRLGGFAETLLERQGLTLETGAPVTGAVAAGRNVAAGFGDGVVRFFRPNEPPVALEAHHGAVLCLAAEERSGAVFTGGDDGRFVRRLFGR